MTRENRKIINQSQIDTYFNIQEEYYNFLHEKMPRSFKGEAKNANGMIKEGGYHTQWNSLSNIERRCNLREIALSVMNDRDVSIKIRCGESYMKAETSRRLFPRMRVSEILNAKEYGQRDTGDVLFLWDVNEVTELIQPTSS